MPYIDKQNDQSKLRYPVRDMWVNFAMLVVELACIVEVNLFGLLGAELSKIPNNVLLWGRSDFSFFQCGLRKA